MNAPVPALHELRALLVYDVLPPGCIAHPVTDSHSAPHLRLAEFAIVDTNDREPVHGELFVIRYNSPLQDLGYRDCVVETRSRSYSGLSGPDGHHWWAAPYVRPRSRQELEEWLEHGRPLVMSEGPFCPGAIERKLVGRVIGVLAPAFEEPKRITVAKGGRA